MQLCNMPWLSSGGALSDRSKQRSCVEPQRLRSLACDWSIPDRIAALRAAIRRE
jgi:hypothetical protein